MLTGPDLAGLHEDDLLHDLLWHQGQTDICSFLILLHYTHQISNLIKPEIEKAQNTETMLSYLNNFTEDIFRLEYQNHLISFFRILEDIQINRNIGIEVIVKDYIKVTFKIYWK